MIFRNTQSSCKQRKIRLGVALEIVNDTEKKGGGLRQTRKQISEDVKDLVCPICGQNNNQEKGE